MMKITTQQGQLDLPSDFSITIEKTNPILSDQGDSSVPVTLPASSRNLAILGHRERIDRANRYFNKMDAIMESGPVRKKGKLVMDTVQLHGGIDATFATDNSDLYASSKEKSLKDIMSDADVKETFASLAAAMTVMTGIYYNGDANDTYDYTVFPVATSPWDNNGTTVYQFNNEPDGNGGLVYDSRTTHEDDMEVSVPAGYGIAPYLKLHKMISRLFVALGYTVTYNCFSSTLLRNIVLVHNCSDCLCNPTNTLYYKDLVPSCTLAEFLEWLLAKFHAQPIVNSDSMTVRIVLMEDLLSAGPDSDISDRVEGDWTLTMMPSSRIVLTPSVDANSGQEEVSDSDLGQMTMSAAKTFDRLLEKYTYYVEVDEEGFASLQTANPVCSGCLVLRKSTGVFYALDIVAATGVQTLRRLGTNHFAYDRCNSDEKEEFSQNDVIPAVMIGLRAKKDIMPYIGERSHYHTSLGKSEEGVSQDIMIAWKSYNSGFGCVTTGTTQAFIPYGSQTGGVLLPFSLTNYSMYSRFWQTYNELLINQSPHLSGRVITDSARYLSADMSRSKLCNGQVVLPIKASGNIHEGDIAVDLSAIMVKSFSDGIADPSITPSQSSGLVWRVDSNAAIVAQQLFNLHVDEIEEEYKPSLTVDATAYYRSYVIANADTIHVGPPSYSGEVRTVQATASITIVFDVYFEDMQYGTEIPPQLNQEITYSGTVTYTLTAG